MVSDRSTLLPRCLPRSWLLAVCLWPAVSANLGWVAASETASRRATLTSMLDGSIPDSVDDLRRMQEQVQQVARQVIPTTVAIRVDQAHGSGVIISPDGYVLTAAHVAGEPNRRARIRLHDGQRFDGVTLGVFRTLDAGLIKIDAGSRSWQHASMGDSDDLVPGEWCLATGHPGGFQSGRPPILRLGRVLETRSESITTDCTLIGGDSGGPLFDVRGRVVGIHSRIGEPLTANLHVPVNTFHQEWDRLAAGDAWGRLPGTGEPPDDSGSPFIGVQGKEGDSVARVTRVFEGSPAEQAGLQPGDVIIRLGKRRVTDFDSLIALVHQHTPGTNVVVYFSRDEQIRQVKLRIGER